MVSYKKLLNVYLPEEIYQALIAYQKQQGFDEASEAFVEILAQFFHDNGKFKRYATIAQLEALEEKVTQLSSQVALLSQAPTRSATIEATRITTALGNDYTHPTLTAQQPSLAFADTEPDEEYDEPDEILHEFIEHGSPPS